MPIIWDISCRQGQKRLKGKPAEYKKAIEFCREDKLKEWVNTCTVIKPVMDFNKPGYLVTKQGWIPDGPDGFLKGKLPKDKFIFTVYAVRAKTDWWIKAAKTHSDANGKSKAKGTYHKLFSPNVYKDSSAASTICWHQQKNECPMVPNTRRGGYSYPSAIGNPMCLARFDLELSFCSTCCCKGGLMKSGIQSSLVMNRDVDCRAWFASMIDTGVRATMTIWGAKTGSMQYTNVCYGPGFKPKEETSDLGESVGRRAGGGMSAGGSFALSSGGNRAGNDEALL